MVFWEVFLLHLLWDTGGGLRIFPSDRSFRSWGMGRKAALQVFLSSVSLTWVMVGFGEGCHRVVFFFELDCGPGSVRVFFPLFSARLNMKV